MVTQERPRVRGAAVWRPRQTLSGADYSSQALFDFNERWRREMGRPLLG
jgi:hypothetical protein